jgi:ELWxxDGT repeat protein
LDSAIGSQAGSNFDHEPAQFDRSKIKSEETPMKSFVPRRPSRLATLSALLTVVVLWQTSAQAQVYLVKDINDLGGSGIIRIGASGSVVFFSADDGTNGEELWRSDGTEVGTYLVKDIWPDTEPDDTNAFSSKPEQFAAAGGYMYFAASGREDPNPPYFDDYEVWVTDGTGGGTASLDIWSGVQSSGPSNFVSMGGSVFVSAYDETYGNEVIKVSAGSGSVLKDIETGVGNSTPNQLAVVHLSGPDAERLLFSASTFALGPELWISDGTEGGTAMVKDINTIDWGSSPQYITGFGGKAYFSADDGVHGSELWVSDGTGGGTSLLKDIHPSGSSSPSGFTAVGSLLYFIANDGTHGYELWKTDGTADGTVMVKDLVDGGGSSQIQALTNLDGTLFFGNWTTADGAELWTSDGTADGTVMFKDIFPGTSSALPGWPDPPELVVANGMLFFAANDGVNGAELWVSNGTPSGTLMVDNLASFWAVEGPKGLTVAGGLLFFQADSSSGRELHAVDTTDIVTTPDTPTGMAAGNTETAYTYTTGGSISLKGHDVQYRFNWGDGTNSGWLATGVTTAEKAWDTPDTYTVTAESRSTVAGGPTSSGLQVTMSFNELISEPQLTGPSTGSTVTTYYFTIEGDSNYPHDLEYTVFWGDGSGDIDWTPFGAGISTFDLSHAWSFAAEHTIQVGVRCGTHTGLENWMDTTMTISDRSPEEIFTDGFESGNTLAW